jgi:L-threonylcarbamoyladenylate synthase
VAAILSPDQLDRAVALLKDGGLVALPTETVYGLAADAADDDAVAALFAAKGRPAFNPLIVHVLDLAAARTLVRTTPLFETLAAAFWPGPVTLVAERRPEAKVSALAAAGLDTLAVRAPAHAVARAVLARLGRPLVMPSANRSGGLSPTRAADAARELGMSIAAVVDGGPCTEGVESTVIDVRGPQPVLLRTGAVSRERIEAVAGPLAAPEEAEDRPRSPGRLVRHYAPRRARLRLDAPNPEPGEAFLGFGPCLFAELNLSPEGDPIRAAARLFACLRALDEAGYARIAVAPIPDAGLGEAINDRLRRAASVD